MSSQSEGLSCQASSNDDALLMERFLAGDDAAFVDLFDRHNRRLFVYCLKLVANREHAQDLTQELWLRVLKLRLAPQKILNPAAFFVRIARNLCLNHLSAQRHHLPLTALPESGHPMDEDDSSEMEEVILTSLNALPFEYREVLVLNVYCGYRFEEIATLLDKSPEAIWKRASRARKQLRTMVLKQRERE